MRRDIREFIDSVSVLINDFFLAEGIESFKERKFLFEVFWVHRLKE